EISRVDEALYKRGQRHLSSGATDAVRRTVFCTIRQQGFRAASSENLDNSTDAEPSHAPRNGRHDCLGQSNIIVRDFSSWLPKRLDTAIAATAGAQGPLGFIAKVFKNGKLPAG